MYFLVQKFASVGAAVALIFTNIVRVAVLGTMCKIYYSKPASMHWARFAFIVLGAAACYALMKNSNFESGGLSGSGVKVAALVFYCVAVRLASFPGGRKYFLVFSQSIDNRKARRNQLIAKYAKSNDALEVVRPVSFVLAVIRNAVHTEKSCVRVFHTCLDKLSHDPHSD